MVAHFIWMISLTIGACATVISAAVQNPDLHLGVTAIVTLAIAIVAVQAHRAAMSQGASRSTLSALTSRHIGLVWIWAASALLVTYEFILTWREALAFVVGLVVVGGLCIGLSIMFERDAKAGRDDEAMLSLARVLNIVQMVGMLLAVVGLIADGKFSFTTRSVARPDWAANNIFFFGAIAVALIGAHALISEKKQAAEGPR